MSEAIKKQTDSKDTTKCSGQTDEEKIKMQNERFEQMIAELYEEACTIRRRSEVSPRILSLRFGSDY